MLKTQRKQIITEVQGGGEGVTKHKHREVNRFDNGVTLFVCVCAVVGWLFRIGAVNPCVFILSFFIAGFFKRELLFESIGANCVYT